MTSKEKYASALDKICHRMLCGGECSVGEGKCELLETIGEALSKAVKYEELTHQPTFSDCIKEWEERGWRWHMDKICIKLINKEDEDIDIHMWLSDKTYAKAYKEFYQYITLEEHNLIHKTIKALEVEENVLV